MTKICQRIQKSVFQVIKPYSTYFDFLISMCGFIQFTLYIKISNLFFSLFLGKLSSKEVMTSIFDRFPSVSIFLRNMKRRVNVWAEFG